MGVFRSHLRILLLLLCAIIPVAVVMLLLSLVLGTSKEILLKVAEGIKYGYHVVLISGAVGIFAGAIYQLYNKGTLNSSEGGIDYVLGYYYDKPYKSPFYYVFRELVIWAFTSGIYVAGLCFCVYYMHTMQISGELYTLTNWTDYPSIFLVVSPVISALACVRIGQGLILLPQIFAACCPKCHKVAFFETTLKHEVLGDVDTYVEGSYYTRREKIGEIGEYSDKIDVYGDVTYKRDDYILNTYSTCDTCQRVCENCKHEGKVFKRKKTSTRRKPVE